MTFKELFWEKEQEYAKLEYGNETKFREAIQEETGKMPNLPTYRKRGILPPFTYINFLEEFLNDDEIDQYLDIITSGTGISDEVDDEISDYRLLLNLSNEYKINKRMRRKVMRGVI